MKNIMKSVLVAGVVIAVTITSAVAKGGGSKPVKDSLHFNLTEKMQNEGVEEGASGTVTAKRTQEGSSDKQSLQISVKGLTPDTQYSLAVALNHDASVTPVADFTTDQGGNASISYSSGVKTKTSGGGGGGGGSNIVTTAKGKNPLPDGLSPLSNVRELDVVNSNSAVVLSSDFTAPDSFQYSVTRDISANGVTASLKIKATTSSSQFQLKASGLNSDTDYNLVVNGTTVQTATSDSKGKLTISASQNGLAPLAIESVSLTDTLDTEIVGTTLP